MMHKMIILVVTVLGLASVGSAQQVQTGQCETIPLMQNFVVDSFATGTWYEIGRESSTNAQCSNLQFTTTTGISVVSTSVVDNFLQTATGTATHTTGTAQLSLQLSNSITPTDLWILNTDYTNYAIAINCVNVNAQTRSVNVWQLGRAVNSYEAELTLTAANTALATINLSVPELQSISHTTAACTQLPVITPGQPVILPGQCDTASISVVQSFDVAAFTGTWNEISSYYSANAVGTCARANYQLVGSTVNVVNTQVLNQQLDTITGTATLIGTDGSGRLSVVLDVQGVSITQELLIIATDYNEYAISYSCANLGSTQRQVNAWILSRSRQLSAQSQTQVNQAIASLLDLNDAYFQTTDQSNSGCFYFPVPQAGVPVVFPGQCDNTIATVPTFNLAQFTGTWHEVETYPKEQQTGSCVNHVFSTGTATTLNLVSNQVVNQAATSVSGSVVTNDGTGRLTLTITTEGQVIEFPYWVLATDYNSYALVYSCVNVDSESRAVYSWKLSRTQTLPAAAATPINNAIAPVQVLDQRYFEDVDQSDTGCFFFPTAQPGVPVVFPGQCDNTIPVQADFDPARYMGLWHDMQSYPSTFQEGSCNNAHYTLMGGVVDVFNTQVINQQLDTINGTAIIPDATQPAKLLVSFPIAGSDQLTSTEYWVLATDYETYSLVYSCANLGTDQRMVFAWKLSRTKELPAAANAAIEAVIGTVNVLDNRYFVAEDQTAAGCFYFPEPQEGVPVVFPGQCDNTIAAVSAFNLAQFTGTWHEVETYPKEQQTGSCVNHVFSTGTATTLNLVSNQVVNQAATSVSGSVVIDTLDGTGRLRLTITSGGQVIEFPYWVLATDYTNYALVYSCVNLDSESRAVYSWKLSRTQTLPALAATPINNAIAEVQVLDQQYFENVDQSDTGCFYFPTAQPGVPVVFPGQCDNTIPVQTPFDPARYQGTWNDIQSYPSTFQEGTCNNAFYTLTEDGVDVFNTQVINQQLDTINGTAVIPDPAQPAKLLVSFPIAGSDQLTSTEYWVLATDYETYSLVYSCANLGTDQRMVFAWKLSRTKELPAAANAAIEAVIGTVNVLDNRYFVAEDQTAAGCFYFPEPQEGVPVVFPGQCDNTIAAVSAFNLAQFTGTWHEVETYPKEQQTGSCVNHVFSTGTATTLNLVSNQVVNQAATSVSGSVVIDTLDGTGRLRLTITSGGQVIEFPYWVLATDYTNYALVYSCVNLDSESRAVYSWKLSRTQTLPALAATPINNAIAEVQVLDQQYFENVDQSDTGCFYFPTAQPGVPVVFPGQCDNTIPVQTPFDPARYQGTWNDIQSYPSTFQEGTCNNAFYTLTEDGVDVFNTQVINQQLDTINGTAVIPDPAQPAKLLVSFPIAGSDQLTSTEYWVLATDYATYSLVYSCVNVGTDQRMVFAWKLGRRKELPAAANAAIEAVIGTVNVLDNRYFVVQDQTPAGCFYFPEPQEGVPVVFPGLCDNTIPVQADFDPARYMGLWHDIQSYPSTFQEGTCNNAHYTLTGGVVDVFNTQVINQQLDIINGTAIIPDATQPAKLLVSFPIAGSDLLTSTEYWVLSTDYTSYSLVYSCANYFQTDERMVFVWKLSRTKELSAAANAAIEAVIGTVNVLDNRYFVAEDQTAAGCFYFPEPQEGVPVVFPGQCDNTIAAVPAFNLAQFTGTWHEIEAYPKAQQTGTCVNHDFSTGTGSTLNLVSNQVVNQVATSASGSVTLDSTDGSGRLWLTLTTGGQVIEIPYWILATDYNSYALAYSCVNLNADFRAVHSWKLSRTQTLPAAAATAINNAIATVQVLGQEYFDGVDQSEAGCLTYPEIPAGEPIILQGQCGAVTPVANFQSAAFAGTWHEAARYASERQTGACAAKQFTSAGANSFTLTQTIVYNERQTVVSGTATLATDGSGTLTATLSDGAELSYTTTIHILDTDYTDFALLYSCENVPGTNNRQIFSWKLSRSQAGLSQAANDRISEVVAVSDLFDAYYQTTGQSSADCFYYPVYTGTPDAIILPATCPTVSGVPNFNPQNYLGNWYDVSRYPIDSQFGSCPTAEYSLVDGVITIRNTMVVDGALRVQNGIGRLSGTGNGLIQATFVSENGEESVAQYYILGTDYTSYSLVYSCRNLGDGSSQVTSWKLSRTPTLTPAANTAINAIISNTQGLLEEYYQSQSHADQDCFYVPEPVPGQSVLFRGGCGEVSGMQGFTPAQYVGWWHEIERYPTDESRGQCTSVDFQSTGVSNSFNVVELGVYDGIGNETVGNAVVSADGSIVITRDGETTRWIVLGTDYNTYSLLYSCEEVTTSWGLHRRVWSAKHSKARSLTVAAQTAMNPIIEANPVLHPQFYESVDQTNSVCFHYRDEITDEVILPGQCDTSIPVQAEFDMSQFAGTWYQMERYPYPQVSNEGTCVGTRYTVDGDGVAVLNWEVVDEVLNTIQGRATVDGASLEVTLPEQGGDGTVTTALHVLITDYEDYALCYTCTNIDDFRRSVGAFKLSRKRSLSNEGQEHIERYIADREEFHHPYFISVLHNDDCEEPSSALLIKSSFIIMLVCVILQLVM